jgi:hypothetical protein
MTLKKHPCLLPLFSSTGASLQRSQKPRTGCKSAVRVAAWVPGPLYSGDWVRGRVPDGELGGGSGLERCRDREEGGGLERCRDQGRGLVPGGGGRPARDRSSR